jgi:hypothetical protein
MGPSSKEKTQMKNLLKSRLVMITLAVLVLLGTGIGSTVGSARSVATYSEVYWDVDTTLSFSEPVYSSDGSMAYVDVSTVSGSIDYMYNDGSYPQDVVDSVNQLIYDYNNGALSGTLTFDMASNSEYVPAEYEGTYDSSYNMAAMNTKSMGPIFAAASKRSGVQAEFSISGSVHRNASPLGASAELSLRGTESDVRATKLSAPGYAFGQSKIKVKDWGKVSKDTQKTGIAIETFGAQTDIASGTVSVKQRISLTQ